MGNTSILLCIPMIIALIALQNPNCPFNVLIAASLLSGVGGGAFASSMSNISFYYPKRKQGYALGMNGGLGNLGVSLSQLITPMVMAHGFGQPPISSLVDGWPSNAGWCWLPICSLSAIFAFYLSSNMPSHGMHTNFVNMLYFYWMELTALVSSFVSVIILITIKSERFLGSSATQIGSIFFIVIIAAVLEHLMIWYIIPEEAKEMVHKK